MLALFERYTKDYKIRRFSITSTLMWRTNDERQAMRTWNCAGQGDGRCNA